MGKDKELKHRRKRKISETDISSSSDSEIHEENKKRRRHRRRHKSSRHNEDSRHRTREERKLDPEALLRHILERFPDVANDLQQLLQLIDGGQGVDLKEISDKSFVKLLKKLFFSLNLEESKKGVFFLPSFTIPTLKVIGSLLSLHMKAREDNFAATGSSNRQQTSPSCQESTKNQEINDPSLREREEKEDSLAPVKRRIIGPEMPSRELLAAAAELTRAQAEFRDTSLEVDNDLLIGPPPPAMVYEVESTNEAERFEEVTRIIFAEAEKPYDVLAVNWRASFDNIKKRYWKLSLMVHPDKCSHPQAHQAFVMLNQAFKDLQDTEKRKAIDEKIKLKEEQEAFQAELKVLREAAQWRRLQGITLEGDEELLAFPKVEPKSTREEWMTELPPERKPGMIPVQSTSFNKSGKEGRGDTSMWTDSPLDKSGQAKQNYLEAYNRAKELACKDDQKKSKSSDVAELVDKYNSTFRSKSLVQNFHEEELQKKQRRKSKEMLSKENWKGAHPWKPWNREKDLSAGRQKVNLDFDGMSQGLSSRFSSGSTSHSRSFL